MIATTRSAEAANDGRLVTMTVPAGIEADKIEASYKNGEMPRYHAREVAAIAALDARHLARFTGAVDAPVRLVQAEPDEPHRVVGTGLQLCLHVGRLGRAQQRAPSALLGQGVVVAVVRNRKLVPHIAGPGLKDAFHLALVERFVEVT